MAKSSRDTFSKMLMYMKYSNDLYPHVIGIQFWSSVIATIGIFANIFFIGQIINLLLKNGHSDKIPILMTVLFLIVLLLLNLFSEYLGVLAKSGSHMMLKNADRNLAEKMMDTDYAIFVNPEFRKLYSSVKTGFMYTGGFTTFISEILNGIISFMTTCLLAGSSLIVMLQSRASDNSGIGAFVNSPFFTIVVVILVLIPLISSLPIAKAEGKVMQKFFAFNIQFNRVIDYYNEVLFREPIFGKTIRLYDADGKIISEARKNMYQQIKRDSKFQIKVTHIASMNTLITYGIVGALYLLISMKSATYAISVGSVVIYVGYLQQVMVTLSTVFGAWGNREASFGTMDQYIKFMNFSNQEHKYGNKEFPKSPRGIKIEFHDVSYQYAGSSDLALDHINLTISEGQRLAIVGPNGSGKTTLVKLLTRLLIPSSGTISINGVNINEFSIKKYKELFSVVFQDFSLSGFSVNDNVSSSEDIDEERVQKSMELSGIWGKISLLPHKGNTSIGTQLDSKGIEFSGGELQKIAIARAWYKDAPIVVLDEPTSALDPISEAEIYEHFDSLVKGKTAIYISHRMSSTRFSSRILVLENGRVIENGDHHTLMKKKGLYYRLYSEQAKYYEK
ncbi:Abc-type multidrug transport system, atpase and p ermease component [Oenococcus oeni]|uniref:ABC transporter ATP-binding protein n=1 Tax=Oenococcus oeni TaxID=1247 RepID=UPI001079D646|nr:ABC transporter ATP-binding protein [Oenococcus oeni]AVI94940.1 hypothetical protein AX764_09060 [Oenococcus oeni]SYV98575.1 Abc-type multidrug transport system, atpase and p ermease component [Oenococcus oeni]SYW05209.1 Abc-type multidrug transport system, atpase and p ermease component [Oenococcus oeni]SYW13388.1 Abc-type multidrug transport system, atpase and p ermease component [Oenococcus oeni]SYW19036.1 Abc-type multidrug transport system, atpase and p ermease component [Oenococcus oe